MSQVAAVVLCGGAARRFGSDKTQAPYAAGTVLDALLDGLPAEWDVVCVGPKRPTHRAVCWTREQPPGGGPLAAVAAGVAALPDGTTAVVILAGDLPAAAPAAVRLVADLAATDSPPTAATAAVDGTGRENPLLAAYLLQPLLAALPPHPTGLPAMTLLAAVPHRTVRVRATEGHDVDTPGDLDALRRRLGP